MGAFDFLFFPEGRVFVHNDCSGRMVFAPFKSCPGVCPGGMVMNEIDTCIMLPTTTDKKSQPHSRVLPALSKEIGNKVDNPQSQLASQPAS